MKHGLIPLGVFGVLVTFLAMGLTLQPRQLPSPLLDRPAPAFRLAELQAPERVLTPQALRGKVWLLNVWASWCAACRNEHPVLVELATSERVRSGALSLYGLNYKDQRGPALDWLARLGNPYTGSAFDADGLVGIDYGVYGVPETFVIDRRGVIRHKLTGPLTPELLRDTVLPLVDRLGAERG